MQYKQFLTKNVLFNFISLIAGAGMVFAFAPFYQFYLAIISPAILLYIWMKSSRAQAFWQGLFFGIGFYGVGVYWVFISVHVFGNTSSLIAGLINGGFVLILSCFIAINGYLLRRWFHQHSNTLLLAFPTLWVISEWVLSWFMTGFPWLTLGYSQITSPLAGYAPLFGVYGASFACTLSAGLIINALKSRRKCLYSLLGLSIVWGLGYGLAQISWTTPTNKPLSVSLIQGNVPQTLKWQPARLQNTLNRYKTLTEQHWQSDLIVWPEAAIPVWLNDASGFINPLAKQAKRHNTTIMTGIPIADVDNKVYYNGLIAIGQNNGQYLKQHLVPFGEYLPFARLIRGIINFFDLPMSSFTAGPEQQKLINVNGIPVANFICYEIAYLDEILDYVPEAQLLINISDDSWFGHSWAADQQFGIARMRALETGRYVLTAGNSGITGIIGPKGKVLQRIPEYKTMTLTGTVRAMKGETPIAWLGLTPIVILMGLLLFMAFIYRPEALKANHGLPH
tara:strand:+ start:85490 stop:87010 length:1521 start_codon:yes stop_codon:yes gene_type:complete